MALFLKNIIVVIILVLFSSFILATWDYYNLPYEAFTDSVFLPSLALITLYITNRKNDKKLLAISSYLLVYLILYFLVIHLFDYMRWFVADGIYNLIFEIVVLSTFVVIQLLFLFIRKIRNQKK